MGTEIHNHESVLHTHGLQDDCPRCEQLAERPMELDEISIRTIWYGYQDGSISGRNNARVVSTLERAWVLGRKLGWHDMRSFKDGDDR